MWDCIYSGRSQKSSHGRRALTVDLGGGARLIFKFEFKMHADGCRWLHDLRVGDSDCVLMRYHQMKRALRAFQAYVRQLMSVIRIHPNLLGWGRDALAYQYRLQTPLSVITRAPVNRSRYGFNAKTVMGESSASRMNRRYRPY